MSRRTTGTPDCGIGCGSGRLVASVEFDTDQECTLRHQETSLYRAPSGAWVFASGTLAWSPALDRPGHVDPRVQRATANLLDHICKRP